MGVGAIFSVFVKNVSVPTGLIDFFHGLQVAIMMALMTNIVQFAWWTVRKRAKKKKMTHFQTYGSVYLLILSSFLVLTQPVCMLVIGSWNLDNFFFDGGDTG